MSQKDNSGTCFLVRTERHDEVVTESALPALADADPSAAATITGALPPVAAGVVGELVDPGSLAALAEEIPRQQATPLTREAYAGVYRAYATSSASAPSLTRNPGRVRAYRDQLERAGRSQATIAKHLSVLRTLAAALGVQGVHDVRGRFTRVRRASRPPRRPTTSLRGAKGHEPTMTATFCVAVINAEALRAP
jgi:hypothetical protein